MREKTIEHQLVMAAKAIGGIAPKLVSPGFDGMPDRLVLLPGGRIGFVEGPGFDGMPDRLVLLPGGRIGFVEVKAPGKVPRPLQVARHRLLKRLGFKVFTLDAPEQIGGILDEIRAT